MEINKKINNFIKLSYNIFINNKYSNKIRKNL